MMAERPVVATAAGGALEIVDDGITGLFVRPNDPEQLAKAVAKLTSDPDYARRIAEAGHAHALDTFGLPAAVAKTNAVIARVVEE
jgi:glycosyltransferase involved in cell wall biosynthesis